MLFVKDKLESFKSFLLGQLIIISGIKLQNPCLELQISKEINYMLKIIILYIFKKERKCFCSCKSETRWASIWCLEGVFMNFISVTYTHFFSGLAFGDILARSILGATKIKMLDW